MQASHGASPDSDAQSPACSPEQSTLLPLRTKAEVDAVRSFEDAYVLRIAPALTSEVLRAIDDCLTRADRTSLSHLRRVLKFRDLPVHVQERLRLDEDGDCSRRSSSTDSQPELARGQRPPRHPAQLYVILCRSRVLTSEEIAKVLHPIDLSLHDTANCLLLVKVPLGLPQSAEEAREWTLTYWPTMYKKNSTLGPQPHVVEEAERSIAEDVGDYMDIASRVAGETAHASIGEAVGAVIVDRKANGHTVVCAAAADARWHEPECARTGAGGNVMAHAAMRAIAMIARKRRMLTADAPFDVPAAYAEEPMTAMEAEVFNANPLEPNGYLCVDMEVYLTHEPCVMCSMALLHSRFGRVVFARDMPRTGGLLAERTTRENLFNSYGLFWRPALNWKFHAWQWRGPEEQDDTVTVDTLHA